LYETHSIYMRVFLFGLPLNVLVSCDYRLEESRVPEKIHLPRYYPNITFVKVCMCYSSRDDNVVYV